MHTDVQRPASTTRPLPISLTRATTASSSQQFIDVRSIIASWGKGFVTSSNMGPEKVFSATVVRIVDAPKPAAALATRPALLRRSTASIEWVAKAICDWKSIMISVWSVGVSSWAPGFVAAVGMARLLLIFRWKAVAPRGTAVVSLRGPRSGGTVR